MKLSHAQEIASKLIERLTPYCERIEIAGSIRRRKPEVKDIEIVAIPTAAFDFVMPGLLPGATFVKNGPRYKQIALPDGIKLDLFLVRPPAEWGVIFLLRTGPADFSRQAVTRRSARGFLPSNCRVKDGQIWRNDAVIPMDEEEDFLKLIGFSGLAPEKRAALVGGEAGDITAAIEEFKALLSAPIKLHEKVEADRKLQEQRKEELHNEPEYKAWRAEVEEKGRVMKQAWIEVEEDQKASKDPFKQAASQFGRMQVINGARTIVAASHPLLSWFPEGSAQQMDMKMRLWRGKYEKSLGLHDQIQ